MGLFSRRCICVVEEVSGPDVLNVRWRSQQQQQQHQQLSPVDEECWDSDSDADDDDERQSASLISSWSKKPSPLLSL